MCEISTERWTRCFSGVVAAGSTFMISGVGGSGLRASAASHLDRKGRSRMRRRERLDATSVVSRMEYVPREAANMKR